MIRNTFVHVLGKTGHTSLIGLVYTYIPPLVLVGPQWTFQYTANTASGIAVDKVGVIAV